jgi:methionyl-tRNA formyltransferase
MKIVLWVGNEPNQKALANKIHLRFPLTGIVTETKKEKLELTSKNLVGKIFSKIFLSKIGKSWWGMKHYYEKKYPRYPSIKLLDVENINSDSSYCFTKELDPDLILVSGTSLIKDKLLSIKPKIGILNLHTGLSPYIKGGPNCTNWCIATEQYHLIGNTIMWIDFGIDTGNILTTEFTEFDGNEDLLSIHIKVMEHAHNIYIKSIDFLSKGNVSNVRQQDISKGKTFYTKQWGLKEKINLIRNLKKFKLETKLDQIERKRKKIKIIKI